MNVIIKKVSVALIIISVFLSCTKETNPEEERIYTQSIERIFDNKFEEGLIEKAEKYYPQREDVVAALDATPWSGTKIPETKYWYFDSFDGVYIPFSITIDAINYYSDFIDKLNINKKDNFFLSAKFEYKAEVTFFENYTFHSQDSNENEFSSVYVVKMDLFWVNYCGDLCALNIDKERIVVFSKTGELLNVFLDGAEPFVVA